MTRSIGDTVSTGLTVISSSAGAFLGSASASAGASCWCSPRGFEVVEATSSGELVQSAWTTRAEHRIGLGSSSARPRARLGLASGSGSGSGRALGLAARARARARPRAAAARAQARGSARAAAARPRARLDLGPGSSGSGSGSSAAGPRRPAHDLDARALVLARRRSSISSSRSWLEQLARELRAVRLLRLGAGARPSAPRDLRRGDRKSMRLQRGLDAAGLDEARVRPPRRAGHDVAEPLPALAGPQHHHEARPRRSRCRRPGAGRCAARSRARRACRPRRAARAGRASACRASGPPSTRSRSSRRAPRPRSRAPRRSVNSPPAKVLRTAPTTTDHGQIHDTRGHAPVVQAGPGRPGGKLRYRVHMDSIGTNAPAIRPGSTVDAALQPGFRRGKRLCVRRCASRARPAEARRSRSRRPALSQTFGSRRLPDARRRAGGHHVAGLERHQLREVGHERRHRVHQVRRGALLHDLAVQPQLDLDARRGRPPRRRSRAPGRTARRRRRSCPASTAAS